jgi:hypothetical protein
MTALYLTIWMSLALFAAAEFGRARAQPACWARPAFIAGLALALVHTMVAFAAVHGWSHQDAVRNTATQTEAVFGVAFGAGVYVNYLFYAAWAADATWWHRTRTATATWALRAFYLVIILNGAIIFAAGWRRLLGLTIVATLLAAWTQPPTPQGPWTPRTQDYPD